MIGMDNFIADLANAVEQEREIGRLKPSDSFINLVRKHDRVNELNGLGYCKVAALMGLIFIERPLSLRELGDIEEEILSATSRREILEIENDLYW